MSDIIQRKGKPGDESEAAGPESTRNPSTDRIAATAVPTEQPLERGWVRSLDCVVKEYQHWGTVGTALALFLAVFTYWSDLQGRVEDGTVQAWKLLLQSAPGSSGKAEALELLNNADGIGCLTRNFCLWKWRGPADLVGIKLGPWYGRIKATCTAESSCRAFSFPMQT